MNRVSINNKQVHMFTEPDFCGKRVTFTVSDDRKGVFNIQINCAIWGARVGIMLGNEGLSDPHGTMDLEYQTKRNSFQWHKKWSFQVEYCCQSMGKRLWLGFKVSSLSDWP